MRAVMAAMLVVFFAATARAGFLPMDDVRTAWIAANKALEMGESRLGIADKLESVASKDLKSWWHGRAMALVQELRASEEKLRTLTESGSTAESEPWLWLADSKMPGGLLYTSFPLIDDSSQKSLDQFMAEHPHDPATLMMAGGRSGIERLLPLLADMAPRRVGLSLSFGDEHTMPRVCDLAFLMVERLSGCSFCEDAFSQGPFNGLREEVRLKAIDEAKSWWSENATSTFAQGIRARMPHAGFYGRVRMSGILAKAGSPEDREYAQMELRKLFDEAQPDFVSYPAKTLWAMGDRYPMDRMIQRLQDRTRGDVKTWTTSSQEIWFLAMHGGKSEWELLTRLEKAQIDAGVRGNRNLVWLDLGGCAYALKSPYAIPALALAAGVVIEKQGAGPSNPNQPSLSGPWACAAALQRLSGEDLGMRVYDLPDGQRRKILDAIREWWQSEGRDRFTLDKIERRVLQGPPFGA